jgi:ribosome biogenesis GTPase
MVLDTPGLRELQLWESSDGISETFGDIEEIELRCRFSDCGHGTEPGCAIRAALEDGTLEAGRWESYLKLQREAAHLERRLDKRLAAQEKKKWIKAGQEGRANMLRKRGGG